MHAFDRQTDRVTDRQKLFSSLVCTCITCSAEKNWPEIEGWPQFRQSPAQHDVIIYKNCSICNPVTLTSVILISICVSFDSNPLSGSEFMEFRNLYVRRCMTLTFDSMTLKIYSVFHPDGCLYLHVCEVWCGLLPNCDL